VHSKPRVPSDIEEFRDQRWRREATRVVQTVADAERFVEQVGFAACMTDSRRPGPSLYVAVCGRRDAVNDSKVHSSLSLHHRRNGRLFNTDIIVTF